MDRLSAQLLDDQQIAIALHYWTPLGGKQQAVLQIHVATQAPATLTTPQYVQGSEPSPELTQLLLRQMVETLNLQGFELNGMNLTVQSIAVTSGRVELKTEAEMTAFPT